MGINREENCDIYITNMLSSWATTAMKAMGMQEILYNLCSGKYSYTWNFKTCQVSDEHSYLRASAKYICFFLQWMQSTVQ